MKNEKQIKSISKFLSLVLRHQPDTIGVQLDENGWVEIQTLIEKFPKEHQLDKEVLEYVVANNDKQRFAFNENKTKIRANQGHSVTVDLALNPTQPPEYLYHGTVVDFLEAIHKEGLKKMSRQHVHLSQDQETAIKVGSRRGKPIILTVRTGAMANDGHEFYLSDNNVWLIDRVPAKYIEFKK